MCIIFIARNVHPDYPLVIAANRDEFLARPTAKAHWWPDAPHIFAGRDLQAGGTWLGYNRQHRIAGITNLRRPDLYQTGAKSRGGLVKGFLDIDSECTGEATSQFTHFLETSYEQYNPFNLLYGDTDKLMVFSSETGVAYEIGDGVHSLSNGVPNDLWPKMQLGISALSGALSAGQTFDPEGIFSLLRDETLTQDDLLPETGIPQDKERLLSSIYIPEFSLNGESYGTRSSSVISVGKDVNREGVQMESRSFQVIDQEC